MSSDRGSKRQRQANEAQVDPSWSLGLGPQPFSPNVVSSSKKVVNELMPKGLDNLNDDEVRTIILHLYVRLTRDTAPADLREDALALGMNLPHHVQLLREKAEIRERMESPKAEIEKLEATPCRPLNEIDADLERMRGQKAKNIEKNQVIRCPNRCSRQ
ncbi:hypothetical protein M0R45_017093 [Rubus argutus]|uniref:Uncharacterized protein n=1 Tax=Rubus argutus TaxID=59490 RepID=A0AAW1XVF2_RUBAR